LIYGGKRNTFTACKKEMVSGIRRLNEMHFTTKGESLAGHLDSQELKNVQEIFVMAQRKGLSPIRAKQGFGGFNLVLTASEGRFICNFFDGSWTLTSLDSEDVYEDYEGEYFDYGDEGCDA
jgi:hypothetical protein